MTIRLKKFFNRPNLRDACFLVALALIGFVFFTVTFSALTLIAGLPVSWPVMPAAFLVTIAGLVLVFFRVYRKIPKLFFPFILAVILVVIVVSFVIAGSYVDSSWDGQDYHQGAILKLAKGWNPYYGYLPTPPTYNPADYSSYTHIWINHYPKATWFFAQNVLSLTGDIELGKAINPLFIAASFFLCLAALLAVRKLNGIFAFLISLLAALGPISLCQFLGFCVDGLIGSLVLCLFSQAFLILLRKGRLMHFLAFAFIVVIIVNVKFTGVVFAALVAFGVCLGILITRKKWKEVLRGVAWCAASAVFALCLVGFHPYMTNWLSNGNPLYPLFGEDSIDVIGNQFPKNLKNMSDVERFFISLFSKSGSPWEDNTFGTLRLKIPFTIAPDELTGMNFETRGGGLGPWESGILLLSLLLLIAHTVRSAVQKRFRELLYLYLVLLWLLSTVFVVGPAWWARYIPHFWFFPIPILVFSFRQGRILRPVAEAVLRHGIIVCMAVNIVISAHSNISYNDKVTAEFQNQLQVLKAQKVPPDIQMSLFADAYRNKLMYRDIDYFEVSNIGARKYKNTFWLAPTCYQVWVGLK